MEVFKKSFFLDGRFITVVIALAVLLAFFSNTLVQSNSIAFEKGGDGLQSYYNCVYHVKYDTTQSLCGGMNYPYGEHMLYTNGHIPFLFVVKILSNYIVDVSNYTIGILNVLMLLSFVVSALFLYLVFRHLKLSDWFAIPVAVGITYLSPQLDRLLGHYCLAYAFVIPGIVYLLLRFHQKPSLRLSVLIAVYALFVGVTHPYHFVVTLPFAAAYLGIRMLQTVKDRKQLLRYALYFVVQVCLPYILTVLWEKLTFPVADRTAAPWGFFDYYSAWEGVFTGGYAVDKVLLSIFPSGGASWEGMAFIGHVAIVFYFILFSVLAIVPFLLTKQLFWLLPIVFIALVLLFIKKRQWFYRVFTPTPNIVINILLWASFAMLIVSFCVPFKVLPEMVKYLGPFRQFRALGRLTWPLFYMVNIAGFWLFYGFIQRFGKAKYAIASLAIVVLCLNAFYRLDGFSDRLNNKNEIVSDFDNQLPVDQWLQGFDASQYQAILPLPMYHCGSENYWVAWTKCSIIDLSLPVSLKTGLPVAGAYLGRTSLYQTTSILQFAQEPYAYPTLLNDIHSSKPFLIIAANCDQLNASEQEIIAHARKITQTDLYSVYAIAPSYFTERITTRLAEIRSQDSLANRKYDNCITQSFDTLASEKKYKGAGAFEFVANTYTTIFETEVTATDSATYNLSFWFYGSKLDLYPQATTVIVNKTHNDEPPVEDYLGIHRHMVLFDGDWFLAELPIKLAAGKTKVKIILINNGLKAGAHLTVDEVQWRPEACDYWQRNNGFLVKNNRFYLER